MSEALEVMHVQSAMLGLALCAQCGAAPMSLAASSVWSCLDQECHPVSRESQRASTVWILLILK